MNIKNIVLYSLIVSLSIISIQHLLTYKDKVFIKQFKETLYLNDESRILIISDMDCFSCIETFISKYSCDNYIFFSMYPEHFRRKLPSSVYWENIEYENGVRLYELINKNYEGHGPFVLQFKNFKIKIINDIDI